MDYTTDSMRVRPRLLRRLSSIELKLSQEETPSRKGTFVSLSVIRTSTFAVVTSIFCAYAWFFVAAVGSSCLIASLIESADASLLSLEQEHLDFQKSLEEIRLGTMLSRLDLGDSRSASSTSDELFELYLVPSLTSGPERFM